MIPVTAGIEVENSQVKLVALTPHGPRARCYELPPDGQNGRRADIARGLDSALRQFETETGVFFHAIPVAVAASHHFSYPSFRLAHQDLVQQLSHALPGSFLASNDGLFPIESLPGDGGFLRFVCGRSLGIRLAAEQHSSAGLAVDCGSTSTELVPCGTLHRPALDPDQASLERLSDGRLTWVGLLETPLDYLTPVAAGYRLVPRMARIKSAIALVAARFAGSPLAPLLGGLDSCRCEVAQAVGLDAEILGTAIDAVAQALYQAAIDSLADSFRRAIAKIQMASAESPSPCPTVPGSLVPSASCLREHGAALMGWGKELLAAPALAACGITKVVDIESAAGIPTNFAAAYGLALAAASAAPAAGGA